MAVTTVLRVRADWELRWFLRLVRRLAGSIRVNFPRHSDTTFLVPSSGHSQWLNNMDLKGNSEVTVDYFKRAIMNQWLNNTELKGKSEVMVKQYKRAMMKQWLNNMDLKGNSKVTVNYLKRVIKNQWLNNMNQKGNNKVTVTVTGWITWILEGNSAFTVNYL